MGAQDASLTRSTLIRRTTSNRLPAARPPQATCSLLLKMDDTAGACRVRNGSVLFCFLFRHPAPPCPLEDLACWLDVHARRLNDRVAPTTSQHIPHMAQVVIRADARHARFPEILDPGLSHPYALADAPTPP